MEYFIEIRQFGFNALTIALIGTIIFAQVQVWGLVKQIKLIQQTGSLKSISLPMFCYFVFHFGCLMMYGIKHGLLTYSLTGAMLGLMYGAVVDQAIKVGARIKPSRLIYIIAGVVALSLAPSPYDYYIMAGCYCMGTFFILLIPYEIVKQNTKGSVSPAFLGTVAVTITFWVIYAACVSDWMLLVNCSVSLLALGVAGWFCFMEWVETATSERNA